MDCTGNQALISQLTIRVLRYEDLPALEWEGEYTHFRRLYRDIYTSAAQGKAVLWVAELPNVGVIGQVFVQLVSGRRELADGSTRAYVYGFRVRPQYRSCGVGAMMLRVLEADLAKRNYRWVTLNVGQDNPDARRFYERHGFQVAAAEPGRWSYIDDQGQRQEVHEPAWRMEKRVEPFPRRA
jgi:ribosomal protein S18 acetylase RimI-like enzyme